MVIDKKVNEFDRLLASRDIKLNNNNNHNDDYHYKQKIADDKMFLAMDKIDEAKNMKVELIENNFQMEEHVRSEKEDSKKKEIEKEQLNAREISNNAQEEADNKLIEAVCAASLLEYNEKKRVEKKAMDEDAKLMEKMQENRNFLHQNLKKAQSSKTEAFQNMLDMKRKAAEMKEKAAMAVKLYEVKEAEKHEKLKQLELLNKHHEINKKITILEEKKLLATKNRIEAEKKANEAFRKAKEMKMKALKACEALSKK